MFSLIWSQSLERPPRRRRSTPRRRGGHRLGALPGRATRPEHRAPRTTPPRRVTAAHPAAAQCIAIYHAAPQQTAIDHFGRRDPPPTTSRLTEPAAFAPPCRLGPCRSVGNDRHALSAPRRAREVLRDEPDGHAAFADGG